MTTVTKLERTDDRHAALAAVHADRVRYHSAPAERSLGYAWSESVAERMCDATRVVLHELWAADLVEVETHRLFAHRGHRVITTTQGYLLLQEWGETPRQNPILLSTGGR
jgi:hypothetical protein